MATERPIEELLHGCAKLRRESAGTPPELDPAARRMLQREVERLYAPTGREGGSFFAALARFWPGLAWATAGVVVVAGTLWLALPGRQEQRASFTLAKSEPAEDALRNRAQAPAAAMPPVAAAPVPATSERRVLADSDLEKLKDQNEAGTFGVERSGAEKKLAFAPAEPMVREEQSAKPARERAAGKAEPSVREAFTAQPPATRRLSEAPRQGEGREGLTVLRFTRMGPRAGAVDAMDKDLGARGVLVSFAVEQEGRRLRIVDGDGSIYSGYLEPAGASAAGRTSVGGALTKAAPAPLNAPGQAAVEMYGVAQKGEGAASPTYFFRVAGTNRSLMQTVVFSGNLLAATNAAAPAGPTGTGRGGQDGFQVLAPEPGLLPLLDSRISGKAVIGDKEEIEIQAVPTGK